MKKQILYLLTLILIIPGPELFPQWTPTTISEMTRAFAPQFSFDGSKLYVGTIRSIYLTTDSGENWDTLWTSQSDTIFYSLAMANNWVFAGTRNGGLLRSSNGGESWSLSNNGLPDFDIRGLVIVANNLGDTVLFAATFGGGIYKSTNFGFNWSSSNVGVSDSYFFTFSILNNGTSNTQIFAGSNSAGIYKSTNLGNSWSTANTGLTSFDVRAFTYDLLSDGSYNLFAGTYNGGIFLSTDDGGNWDQVNNGLGSTYIWSLTSTSGDSASPLIFAGTTGEVYKSSNNGTLWEDYNQGFPSTYLLGLAICGDYLFAGTSDAGLRRRLYKEPTNTEYINTSIPTNFELSQNYPNPFNPSTKIRYSIPSVTLSGVEGSRVQLKVYDVLGNEVATLVNEEKPAGSYEVDFSAIGGSASGGNASQLSSGIYLYKLTAGNFIQTRKMILVK